MARPPRAISIKKPRSEGFKRTNQDRFRAQAWSILIELVLLGVYIAVELGLDAVSRKKGTNRVGPYADVAHAGLFFGVNDSDERESIHDRGSSRQNWDHSPVASQINCRSSNRSPASCNTARACPAVVRRGYCEGPGFSRDSAALWKAAQGFAGRSVRALTGKDRRRLPPCRRRRSLKWRQYEKF
jgi:hypothetical protein